MAILYDLPSQASICFDPRLKVNGMLPLQVVKPALVIACLKTALNPALTQAFVGSSKTLKGCYI